VCSFIQGTACGVVQEARRSHDAHNHRFAQGYSGVHNLETPLRSLKTHFVRFVTFDTLQISVDIHVRRCLHYTFAAI
jgi:hypothetical protein